ncbi:partner and localizer of BRCA2 [Hoplias malabaricus]|uniref:partner and localizer of BRCA2 n=1 Tax=Hoplias malabaricus TaxID=27720 RepID=UPI00346288CA
MTEESLTSENKERLRRRLELLQREYERTVQRLQRAERREAVRRHVQNRISDQNRLLEISTSGSSQLSPASSSVLNSDLLSDQNLPPETEPDDDFPTTKKIPLVRFHLPDTSDVSPCSTPSCRRSPTKRLRSKQSRLRLQRRERESDTDSREKGLEDVEERLSEVSDQKMINGEGTSYKTSLDMERVGESGQNEKNQNGWKEKESDWEMDEEKQREGLKDGLRPNEESTDVKLRMNTDASLCSAAETPFRNQSPVEIFPTSQLEVPIRPVGQSEDKDSQSSPSASDQLFLQIQSCQSHDRSDQSQDKEDANGEESGAEKDCEIIVPPSSEKPSFLDSCTLIEGLPFPVEYYVRTTRRMAASQSPVDLDAVIHSQLSGARGRRRSNLSQRQTGGHVTSEASRPDGRLPDHPRHRGRGQRGRRGHRRKRAVGMTTRTESCSESLPDSESATESLIQSQAEPLPRASVSQTEPIQTPEPALNKPHFKNLSDSQLNLDCKLLPDEVYPIFRRRPSQAERVVLSSQDQASTNDSSPLLLSLASLTEALKMKNYRHLGQLLTTFDVQDFHLPDNEFGQLKLDRLRTSYTNVEPLIPSYSAYNTRRSSRLHGFRSHRDKDNSEVECEEQERFKSRSLTPSCSLEGSFPLSFPNRSGMNGYTESTKQIQSEADSQKSDIPSGDRDNDPGPEHSVQLSSAHQLDESLQDKGYSQTSMATEDKEKETQLKYNEETHGEQQSCPRNEAPLPSDQGSQCAALLNLSASLTSNTQHGPDLSLPLLGITPRLLNPTSPTVQTGLLASPSDQSLVLCPSQLEHVATPRLSQNEGQAAALTQSQAPATRLGSELRENTQPATDVNISECAHNDIPENSPKNKDSTEEEAQHQDITEFQSVSEYEICPETGSQSQRQTEQKDIEQKGSGPVTKPCTTNETSVLSANQSPGSYVTGQNDTTVHMASYASLVGQTADTETAYPGTPVASCDSLQKTHTIKALEGGCVLDVCLLRRPSEDWCVCVAGEWSVCVWVQKVGVQQWDLLHTWTFTQSVISLQEVPDSPGLLCVSLGRLEITEVRVLCCASPAGEFSQAELCKGALQAVVAVSDRRLVCCTAPGAQQKVTVFTLSPDGRATDSLTLVSTSLSIQTLAAVENKKDALIGWTECKTLLIWNMKSGLMIQTVRLAETMSTAVCLRGWSYKGALCVLLQRAGACDEKNDSPLFTMIAINPLTTKHFTLNSFCTPAPHIERLLDDDVCESLLAGVFQSGHLVIWDLRGGVSRVLGDGETQTCRLARWAGPRTLLTGYLNGEVNLYQCKPTEAKGICH